MTSSAKPKSRPDQKTDPRVIERRAIHAIQNDMIAYAGKGHNVFNYSGQHAELALLDNGINPGDIQATSYGLVLLSMIDLCERRLGSK